MRNNNKKIVLGVVGGLILLAGLGYQNCGSQMGVKSDEGSSFNNLNQMMLQSPLSGGTYTVKFADGTKAEISNPAPVKYTVKFKDGSTAELLSGPMK